MLKMSPLDALFWLQNRLPKGGRVYVPGCSGEPLLFAEAMRSEPTLARALTFIGIWIPGINKTDYASLHPSAKSELIFLSADFQESFTKGDARLRPLSYTQSFQWLEQTQLDAALLQVSPPDQNGMCSLGVSADFTTAISSRPDIAKIAHINPAMPAPPSSPKIPLTDFDVVVEREYPLLTYPTASLPPVFDDIASNVAGLINDGDTLQFGLGSVQLAVLKALSAKRNLRIHAGMISDPVLDAVECGAIRADEGAVTTGVALGTSPLHDFATKDSRVRFSPVRETHAITTLSAIENFTAINSVIEVDLFGQANAEYLGGRQVSGTGGLVDFLRGAAIAPGGKPIIALASAARKNTISRIVPKLTSPTVSIARADVGIVVTEQGIADLRGKTIDDRARALINIAHPDHRHSLNKAWSSMREGL